MSESCLILLVEDDANDAFFVRRALEKVGYPDNLLHFPTVEEAMDYLRTVGPQNSENAVVPNVILADSSISARESGVDFLEWMRAQQGLGNIPFVILSGGIQPETRARAEAAGVDLIFRKSFNFAETVDQMREILTRLPEQCRPWLK
jgi:CheY-like chemotaxis protein